MFALLLEGDNQVAQGYIEWLHQWRSISIRVVEEECEFGLLVKEMVAGTIVVPDLIISEVSIRWSYPCEVPTDPPTSDHNCGLAGIRCLKVFRSCHRNALVIPWIFLTHHTRQEVMSFSGVSDDPLVGYVSKDVPNMGPLKAEINRLCGMR